MATIRELLADDTEALQRFEEVVAHYERRQDELLAELHEAIDEQAGFPPEPPRRAYTYAELQGFEELAIELSHSLRRLHPRAVYKDTTFTIKRVLAILGILALIAFIILAMSARLR